MIQANVPLFIIRMTCLIGSLVVFIHDTSRSLAAFRLELTAGADDTAKTAAYPP